LGKARRVTGGEKERGRNRGVREYTNDHQTITVMIGVRKTETNGKGID